MSDPTNSTAIAPDAAERTPLNLGAMTPHAERAAVPAASPRARDWRPDDHAEEKERSGVYNCAGSFTLAARARRADKDDCRICDEPAADPVRAQCCGAVFCRDHIRDWMHGPAASTTCPACTAPCVLPAGALGLIKPKQNRRLRPHAIRAASSFAVAQTRKVATVLERFRALILIVLVLALLAGVLAPRGREELGNPEDWDVEL